MLVFGRCDGADLSYVWRMAIPKAATRPIQRALIAQPTAIVRPAPLTAESTSAVQSQQFHREIILRVMKHLLGVKKVKRSAIYSCSIVLRLETQSRIVRSRSEKGHTLSSNDRRNDTPAHLEYYIKDTSQFRRPVSHKVSTKYLSSQQGSYRLANCVVNP